jgi:hypothetical protein
VAPAAHAGVRQVWPIEGRCQVFASSVLSGTRAQRQRALVAAFVRLTASADIGSNAWQCGACRKVVPSSVCPVGRRGGDRHSFAVAAAADASLALWMGLCMMSGQERRWR